MCPAGHHPETGKEARAQTVRHQPYAGAKAGTCARDLDTVTEFLI
jgi:topoisomerase IA-like protein